MNRHQLNEIVAKRTAFVRERILHNIAFSPLHAHMSCNEQEALADQLAREAMSFDQPGYNNGNGVAPAVAWAPDEPEVKSARFKAALGYGDA